MHLSRAVSKANSPLTSPWAPGYEPREPQRPLWQPKSQTTSGACAQSRTAVDKQAYISTQTKTAAEKTAAAGRTISSIVPRFAHTPRLVAAVALESLRLYSVPCGMSCNLSGLGPLRHRSRHCHPCCLHGHHPLRPRRLCFALAERALGPCCLSSESLASLSLPTYIRTYVSLALNARFDSISLHLPTFRLHNPPSLPLRRTSVRTCDPSPTSYSRFKHPPSLLHISA